MVNVTVINLKSIIKYGLAIIILFSIFSLTKFINTQMKSNNQTFNVSLVGCISETLPKISGNAVDKNIEKISSRTSVLKRMLSVELPMMDRLIVDGEENEDIKPAEENNKEEIQMAQTDVKTEEINENNISPNYNGVFGTVKIKNESDKEITQEILTPNISLENNKDVIIFHTHTCESYTASEAFNYEMTGSYRTTDLKYSVARVGTELEKYLKNYGYNVIHNQTYHDHPAYSGSYGRSLTTVKNILNNSSAQLVIDLHRDAVRK